MLPMGNYVNIIDVEVAATYADSYIRNVPVNVPSNCKVADAVSVALEFLGIPPTQICDWRAFSAVGSFLSKDRPIDSMRRIAIRHKDAPARVATSLADVSPQMQFPTLGIASPSLSLASPLMPSTQASPMFSAPTMLRQNTSAILAGTTNMAAQDAQHLITSIRQQHAESMLVKISRGRQHSGKHHHHSSIGGSDSNNNNGNTTLNGSNSNSRNIKGMVRTA